MVEEGNWMRSKETGEAVKVIKVGTVFVEYSGEEVIHGEVRLDHLNEEFDLMDDPTSREGIEYRFNRDIACRRHLMIEAG